MKPPTLPAGWSRREVPASHPITDEPCDSCGAPVAGYGDENPTHYYTAQDDGAIACTPSCARRLASKEN